MQKFLENYWLWITIIVIVILVFLFFIMRFYQLLHLDYKWEKMRHFPQWSNNVIITRDNYLLHINYNFIDKSKYIIIGVHGMGASKEDFDNARIFFGGKGISLLSFDQRGWGENKPWKYHTLGTTIADINDVITVIKEKFPEQKIILLGESLGSALAALAAKKLSSVISGIIITNFVTKKQVFNINFILFCKFLVGFLLYKNLALPIHFEMEKISSNPDYIEYGQDRSLTNAPFTVIYTLQARKISAQVVENIRDTKKPIMIIQSKEDVFFDADKFEKNKNKWIENKNITCKFYQKGYHAILNEPNINEIFNDCYQWILKNIA